MNKSSDNHPKRLLIGDISSYKAISICKFIKKNYPSTILYSFDFKKSIKLIHTKYADQHFTITREKQLIELFNLINEHSIDFFVPVMNEMMESVLRDKSKFEETLSYFGNYGTFKKLHNKYKLWHLAKKVGVKVPEIYESIEAIKTPCVLKPTEESSARGVKYFYSDDELPQLETIDLDNYLIQQYVEGIGIGYSVFAQNGEIITGYGHKRLGEYPVSGGSSVYRENFFDERMRVATENILKQTNWSGFAMFEFKHTPKGEIYLLEVNPRVWGSINQGLQNGINYFSELLGHINNDSENNKKAKTYLSPLIYIAFLKYALRGNFKPIVRFLANIRKNKPDVSLFDDPLGWSSMILRKLM